MQIRPLSTEALPAPSSGTAASQVTGTALTGTSPPVEAPAMAQGGVAPLRSAGTRQRPDQMQVARTQQTLAYLETLGQALEGLKSAASGQLVRQAQQPPPTPSPGDIAPPPPVSAQPQLQRVQALWQQRAQASGGGLDAQLQLQPDGATRQAFKVPGLDARSLQQSQGETLSFITGANPTGERRIVTAVLTSGLPAAQQARTLDLALAPAGVRLHLDAQGGVSLSTRETDWPAVRDGFSVQGGGVRFPARQFHRLQASPVPDALRPETWRTDDTDALRDTLRQLVPAQQRVQAALQGAQAQLDAQDQQLQDPLNPSGPSLDERQAWATRFAQDFQQVGEQPPYAVFAALAPALQGISRPRVEALLR